MNWTKPSIKLTIPEPCSEDWQQMTPVEKGRFCEACSKCVMDFTAFSDEELLQYFAQKPSNVCGRLKKSQLQRTIGFNENTKSQWLPKALLSVAVSLGILNAAQGQEFQRDSKVEQRQKSEGVEDLRTQSSDYSESLSDSMRVIAGTVRGAEDILGFPGVNVVLVETGDSTMTDINGYYQLNIPSSSDLQKISLEFVFVGHHKKIFSFSVDSFPDNLDIEMEFDYSLIEIQSVVVGGIAYKPTLWQRIKNLFRKKEVVCESEI
jgi:hypothetical protein